jgi:DNA-binding protein H-NS
MYVIKKRPAPAKKTKGYDVYHVNSTRRVWVGEGRTKKDAEDIVASGRMPGRKK